MAVQRKLHSDIHQVRDIVTTADGRQTRTETWHGPYTLLEAKQASVKNAAKSTNLTPNGATSSLTITYETPAPTTAEFSGSETITEVIWREARVPVAQHKMFDALSNTIVQKIMEVVESREPWDFTDETQAKLYGYLVKGITEYSIGVPVVRRTKTKSSGRVGGGKAWYKDNPPVRVPGTWTWVKTADERRRDGNTYTQVEEWTGNNDALEAFY